MKPETIISTVARQAGMTIPELMKKTRRRKHVDYRAIAYALLWKEGVPVSTIGRLFDRHHSTIIFALTKADDLLITDKNFKQEYEQLKNELYGEAA